jgi:hypothetical protein
MPQVLGADNRPMASKLTMWGGISLGVGTGLAVWFGNAHSACSSDLGVLAQGLSSSAANTCAGDNFLFYLGVAGIVVGAVLLIAGIVSRSNSVQGLPVYEPHVPTAPSTAPPGWYPDPTGSGSMQWWDGSQWVRQFAPASTQRAQGGPSPGQGQGTQ